MTLSDFNAFLALNMIHPFTYDAQSERDGLLITELCNQKRKRPLKPEEIFPYLKRGVPNWLSDKTVQVAMQLIDRHEKSCAARGVMPDYEYVHPKIIEELEIEKLKDDPCQLKINQLEGLLENINVKSNTTG